MLLHPEVMRVLTEDRVETLRRAGSATARHTGPAALDGVEVRLCRVADDPELTRLAELEGRQLPGGRLVVAVAGGRVVAAHPLGGGSPLADPFVRTAHILPLLEQEAARIGRAGRPHVLLRSAGLLRRALQA